MRNILLKNDLETTDGKGSWKVIEKMYDKDQNGTRICPKLTKDHLYNIKNNSFIKMRVSIAAQTLSHSVASGIDAIVSLKGFDDTLNKMALPTSKFIRNINNLFDVFNSRKIIFTSYYKAPIS